MMYLTEYYFNIYLFFPFFQFFFLNLFGCICLSRPPHISLTVSLWHCCFSFRVSVFSLGIFEVTMTTTLHLNLQGQIRLSLCAFHPCCCCFTWRVIFLMSTYFPRYYWFSIRVNSPLFFVARFLENNLLL